MPIPVLSSSPVTTTTLWCGPLTLKEIDSVGIGSPLPALAGPAAASRPARTPRVATERLVLLLNMIGSLPGGVLVGGMTPDPPRRLGTCGRRAIPLLRALPQARGEYAL